MLDLDRTTALMLIAQTTFHPFTKADYQIFAGVESDNPMIGETDKYVIIIDGVVAHFNDDEGNFVAFYLTREY